MQYGIFVFLVSLGTAFEFHKYVPPFNQSDNIYKLCTDYNDRVFIHGHEMTTVNFYLTKYILCWQDYTKFVPPKHHAIVWFMKALRGCEVNQIFTHNKHTDDYHRNFQLTFLKYSYILICERGHLLPERELFYLYVYSSLFNTLYQVENQDRQFICNRISDVYANLYGRCYVPHVEKRQKKIKERCNGISAPLLKFQDFFQRFSRSCDSFDEFVQRNETMSNVGRALTKDVVYMNLLSSNLVSNIHSDSELPSLVLKTRLLLQHFSLASIKLYENMQKVKKCRIQTQENLTDSFLMESEEDRNLKMSSIITHNCCPANNLHICDLNNERQFQKLANSAWIEFYIEGGLLIAISCNTILLMYLLMKTRRNLSTATVLFVLNIMFSNILFIFSFVFFFTDLFGKETYGAVNEDYQEKSPELIIAETLQTHLFESVEFRKHLVQETLYSLAQNGSLTGLIHLLVLVLVVINRSMAGKSIHLSRVSVISVFSCVWIFLIASHALFSTMQMSAIENLDQLFSILAKGRASLKCHRIKSGYEEIASHCDRTAVFHAFGAYLLRGHTLFTVLFLAASIVIFVITVTYHIKVRRQHEIIHNELRAQSPHRRREKLFHTLILSIFTFFVSVLGQTYIEIAVFWVNEREDIAQLSKWYHLARILAFIDPVMNPLIVVARTPALRRQLRSQWTTLRSQASSKNQSKDRNSKKQVSVKRKRTGSKHRDTEVCVAMKTDRPIVRTCSNRRSQDSQTHNSVV